VYAISARLRTVIVLTGLLAPLAVVAAGTPAVAAAEPDVTPPVISRTGLRPELPICCSKRVEPRVTDDVGIDRVELVVGGQVVATDRAETYFLHWDTTSLSGPVTATVRAYDLAGNVAEASTTVTVDNQAPDTTLTVPTHNGYVHGLVPMIVTGEVGDVYRITTDQGVFYPTTAGPWTSYVDTSDELDLRGLSLKAEVFDRAGNLTSMSRGVTVDNAAPVLTVTKAPKGLVRGTVTVGARAFDHTEASLDLLVDGRRVATTSVRDQSSAVNTLIWKAAGVSRKVTLTVRSTDFFGQVSKDSRVVTVDNVRPTVSVSKAPKHKAKVKGKVAVSVTAKDMFGVGRVELLVDGKVVATDKAAAYAFTVNTAKYGKTMKVQVRAYDKAGNVAATSSRTWYRS
jgi:hypothetical protein